MNESRTNGAAGSAIPPVELQQVRAYGAVSETSPLGPLTISRRTPGPRDVQMQVLYCGVCHSDLHQVRDEWHENIPTVYPCVPGHEIVGRVTATGRDVRNFREGDLAAVGCLVDSCGACAACAEGARSSSAPGRPPSPTTPPTRRPVVSPMAVTPTASWWTRRCPARAARPGPAGRGAVALRRDHDLFAPQALERPCGTDSVGVVGLGGLGHMAVKLARALEARVVVFTNSAQKVPDALRLGAHDVVLARTPPRCRSIRASSISSSTPSRRRTT